MQFLTVRDDFQIEPNAAWLAKHGDLQFAQNQQGTSFYSFEENVQLIVMTTQGGSTYWMVVYSPIDSPIYSEQGKCSTHPDDIAAALNGAMAKLLSRWLPSFLPD